MKTPSHADVTHAALEVFQKQAKLTKPCPIFPTLQTTRPVCCSVLSCRFSTSLPFSAHTKHALSFAGGSAPARAAIKTERAPALRAAITAMGLRPFDTVA
jgi:hypothetical protein